MILSSIGLLLGVIFLSAFLAFLIFKPLFSIQKELSISILDKILPEIQKSNIFITTVASSAIILTFTFLQAFGERELLAIYYLILSWSLFATSAISGIISGILIYILKTITLVELQLVERLEGGPGQEKKKIGGKLGKVLKKEWAMRRILFMLQFLLLMSFGSAVVFFFLFAKINII